MDVERMEKLAKKLAALSVEAKILELDNMAWTLQDWANEIVEVVVKDRAAAETAETEEE